MRLALGFVVFALVLSLVYALGGMPALAVVVGAGVLALLDRRPARA
jgi:hypothetical protein